MEGTAESGVLLLKDPLGRQIFSPPLNGIPAAMKWFSVVGPGRLKITTRALMRFFPGADFFLAFHGAGVYACCPRQDLDRVLSRN
jgi:hypothetical protein